jgi:nicotinamide riboside kinase
MKNKLVGFMGAPGTGKTTLSSSMKEYVLLHNISSDVCTEYAREFCFKYGVPKNVYSQYRINQGQLEKEDILTRGNNEYIFSDSPVWMGYVFSLIHLKSNDTAEIKDIIGDIYDRYVIKQINRYYKVFHLKNPNPYDDGCRDMEANKIIAEAMDGFVLSHQHLLPIITINVDIMNVEERKKIVWENIREKK